MDSLTSSASEGGEGEEAGLILASTSFYAEQGGQTFDTGVIESIAAASAAIPAFQVRSVQVYAGYVLHLGVLQSGEVRVGDLVAAKVSGLRV